ncbi:MAG: hypothetical protein CL582_23480 [Alteromonadaceae bacterium]|nr:hypothetical protein [Alteromonadaceae bacterium]
MNALVKYAAKKKLIKGLTGARLESRLHAMHRAEVVNDAYRTRKLPSWAKQYMYVDGGMHKVKKWPKDPALRSKVEMLQSGRQDSQLFKGAPFRKPGSGKPEGGWAEGSLMDTWRQRAGRK